jgi:hypothetical protein
MKLFTVLLSPLSYYFFRPPDIFMSTQLSDTLKLQDHTVAFCFVIQLVYILIKLPLFSQLFTVFICSYTDVLLYWPGGITF